VPGLGASYGRGAATTFQRDLSNSDCIVIMGSNMAEAHPVGFRWPLKAKERGAVLIHVDPRYTRTSALADVHVAIRTGTDIAFLGGIINYIIEHNQWFDEYVKHYTNASFIITKEYLDPEQLDGLFDGYDPVTGQYDLEPHGWAYEHKRGWRHSGGSESAIVEKDENLQHPRCVFQILKRHYARYTPENVARICGCRAEDVVNVAQLLCRNSGRERTSVFVYAVGWTQHSTGVQMIRAAAIIQLLLGNTGRPGGGVMAMRGHCSIQGSTDIPTLFDLLPTYLPQPIAIAQHRSLRRYLKEGHGYGLSKQGAAQRQGGESESGYWVNMPRFMISLLKAWYGEAASWSNDYGYDWLPKIEGDWSQLSTFDKMAKGKVKGLFLIGQNPAAGAPNAKLNRAALRQLDWLVVRDWFEHESASFWYADPEIADPKTVKTEVFLLPAAVAPEKDGCVTNTDRLIQWHAQAADPPGDCRSDSWFMYHLGLRLKRLYENSDLKRDLAIRNLTWNYQRDNPKRLPDGRISRIVEEPDIEKILMEINGYRVADGQQLKSFDELADDGSTACGGWLYCGVFPDKGVNRANHRDPTLTGTIYPEWCFSWPHNRRIMYNRASADPHGRPWSDRKKLVWWNPAENRWTGLDVPDFEQYKPPGYRPEPGDKGMDAIAGDAPFIQHPDGKGWLFAPAAVKDGPLPTHYEPRESPVKNPLYRIQFNPTLQEHKGPLNPLAPPLDAAFPIVATTCRLTEHYLSGPMSRFNSWLNELQPEMFVEVSPELAAERGFSHGDWIVISTPRGKIEARAMVTRRIKPLTVEGRVLHQIGLPIHWGYAGEVVGAIANDLTSLLTEPNVAMHEGKSFACQVQAGRLNWRNRRPSPAPRQEGEPVPDTPPSAQPEGHNT
jgi:formate dehydrogenase major subunit